MSIPRTFLSCVLLAAGCAVSPLRADVAAHGNLPAEVKATDHATARRTEPRPQVILLEPRTVRAIDPRTAVEQWARRLPVNGHGAVTSAWVLVPVRGHRLVALDRRNGEVGWVADLPGEVVVGLAASERYAVLTVAGRRFRYERKDFGRVVLVDLSDGTVRWARRSRARLGVPAIRGRRVFVPVGTAVAALRVADGREVARAAMPVVVRRADVARGTVVAGTGTTWVDLEAAHYRPLRIGGGEAAFLTDHGVDPGPAEDERIAWWVRVAEDGSTPREGVLLARGAVVAVRFDARGEPDRVHWIHNARDGLEYVGFHVGRRRVVLVREDGAIVQLDTADGSEVDAIAGGPPVRGALFADLDPDDRPVRLSRPDPDKVRARAEALLARTDPRLLPAQRLVLRTFWRDGSPGHRALVEAVAGRGVRGRPASPELRAYALDLRARPWGRAGRDERRRLAERLVAAAEPGPRSEDVATLARRAVSDGDPSLVPAVAALLEAPHLPPGDVEEVARALRDMDRVEGVEPAAQFVLRYHADPRVVVASRAMEHLVDHLARWAERGNARAREVLDFVAADPLTDRSLLAYIAARRPAPVVATASHERREPIP